MRIAHWIAIALTSLLAGQVHAQDFCGDILKEGIYSYSSYKEDSYYNQIIWSRFMKSNYETSKTDQNGGFGVPIGKVVFNGNYSKEEYEQKKSQIENQYFNNINSSREIDIALMSGDPEIIGAWKSCMQQRGGGISVRFEPTDPLNVFMTIQYFNQGTKNKEKLAEKVELPKGVTVTSGEKCLKKGASYVSGKACIVQLKLDNPLTTMEVVVDGKNSSAKAWLPARIQLNKEVKPYPFDDKHKLHDWAHKRTTQHRTSIVLSEEEIKQGWSFDKDSAKADLIRITVNNTRNRCHSTFIDVSSYRLSYGYTIYAGNRRRRDGHIECMMIPYILMRREVWTAMPTYFDNEQKEMAPGGPEPVYAPMSFEEGSKQSIFD